MANRWSVLKSFRPVVFEGNLNAIVVHVKAIGEVHTAAKLKLAAHGDPRCGVEQQIPERVTALMKGRRQLPVRVVNVHQGVPRGAGEALTPLVVQKRNDA